MSKKKLSNYRYEIVGVNTLKEINKFRESLGMKKIVPIKRECTRCLKEFISQQSDERMCYNCRDFRTHYFDDGY